LTAAYLHDTLEDTKMKAEEIASKYGLEVLELVENVTDGQGKTEKKGSKTLGKKSSATNLLLS